MKEGLPKDTQERFDKIWGSDVWDGDKIHPVDIEDFIIEELRILDDKLRNVQIRRKSKRGRETW